MSRRLAAVGLAVVATILGAAADVLVLLHHARHWPHAYTYWSSGTFALPLWAAVGLLVVLRVRGNLLGWLALGAATVNGVMMFTGALATYLVGAGAATAAGDALAGVCVFAQMGAIGLLIVFAQLAPDGRPVSRRWWPATAATVLGLLLVGVANLGSAPDVSDLVPVARAPLRGAPGGLLHAFREIATVLVLGGVLAAVAGLTTRWRSGDVVRRQQLKWMFYLGLTAAFLVAIVQPIGSALWPDAQVAPDVMWAFVSVSVPIGTTLGILRYRLYDIDRIVSRTASYALLTGLLIGGYVGIVALTEDVLSFSSSFAVAASTLAVAALFQPLRRRVQRVIDRRFDRERFDAARVVDAFAVRLRDEVDVDAVHTDLVRTVERVVQPGRLSLWLAAAR